MPSISKYFSHLIFFTVSYKSSSSYILVTLIGFKIRIAVLKAIFALYIKPSSPLKETLLIDSCTSFAPKFINSSAKTPSKPNMVVATILKSLFILVKLTAKVHFISRKTNPEFTNFQQYQSLKLI